MKKTILTFLSACLLSAHTSPTFSCSSMASPLNWEPGFAHNFDWPTVAADVEGGFTLNKRGVSKIGVLFGATKNLSQWTSKYASVAFSITGPEYPASGINEKGLFMITQALPETEYPDLKDPRPAMNTTQFVQYHLDNSETIDDIVASDAAMRPFSTLFKVHFFACDATRRCAVIQYIKGKMVVYKDSDLPYSVITNNLYPESAEAVKTCSASGCTEKDNSLWRFAELAYRWKNASAPAVLATDFWPWLDHVAQLPSTRVATRFQVVFDPNQKTIYARHWKTKKTMMFKYDFSTGMDCQKEKMLSDKNYLEIDPQMDGDQTHQFQILSLARRAEMVERAGLPTARAKEMAEAALDFICL